MFQTVQGVDCFVVDLPNNPKELLPIIADVQGTEQHVQALNLALETGVITKAGKYGVNVTDSGEYYNIFLILE